MTRPVRPHVSRVVAALFAVAAIGAASPARSAVKLDPLLSDLAQYRVYVRDRMIGTEIFTLEPHGDSVIVVSNVDEMLPTPDGPKRFQKKVGMSVKALDFGLLDYTSETTFLDRFLRRGITVAETTITGYHENKDGGYGDTMLRPPGRVYIIDSQAFVLIDVLLRSLHGKLAGERSLPVIVLTEPRDTVLEVTMRPGALDSITWQGRKVTARRITLTDGRTEFLTWTAKAGHLLRLEEPVTGLRVERDLKAPSDNPPARADSVRLPVWRPKTPPRR